MPGKQVSKANRERIIGAYITETGSTEPKQRPGRPKTLKKRDTRALK
ncbi:16086_t:CDS:2, partial [Rhizophagus irregularis]